MRTVCKVYWEMCREVVVDLPDRVGDKTTAAEFAKASVDITAPGAEYVPDSVNCDPETDVQQI
jgi:hypothetical protein